MSLIVFFEQIFMHLLCPLPNLCRSKTICWKFCGYSNCNCENWFSFAYVQPHVYTPGKQYMVKSTTEFLGTESNWKWICLPFFLIGVNIHSTYCIFSRENTIIWRRKKGSFYVSGRFVMFILCKNIYMKGANNFGEPWWEAVCRSPETGIISPVAGYTPGYICKLLIFSISNISCGSQVMVY